MEVRLFVFPDDDLEEFLRAVIEANDRGISPLRNSTNEMNWSFGQALFFSSTVVTTIGKFSFFFALKQTFYQILHVTIYYESFDMHLK